MSTDCKPGLPPALTGRTRVAVHMADPGACAVLSRMGKRLEADGATVSYLLEGWSAAHAVVPKDAVLPNIAAATGHDLLLLGARSDFAASRALIDRCRALGLQSLFVFDAWKNHRLNFVAPDTGAVSLPDRVGVIDAYQRQCVLAELADVAPPDLDSRLVVLGHPAIEEQAASVAATTGQACANLRHRLGARDRRLLLFLNEPMRRDYLQANGLDPGYDEFDALAAFFSHHVRPGDRVVVKLHPRQDPVETVAFLAGLGLAETPAVLAAEPLEPLLAAANHVFGMTSTALHAAIAAGRPVTSLQPGRNAYGQTLSHPALEARLAP